MTAPLNGGQEARDDTGTSWALHLRDHLASLDEPLPVAFPEPLPEHARRLLALFNVDVREETAA